MTEQDLKEYLQSKKKYEEAKEARTDFEAAMYSPTVKNIDGMPAEKKYPDDKMALIAHRHGELLKNEQNAKADFERAEANLLLAMSFLSGDERVFFEKRYMEGNTFEAIMLGMHISKKTSCRIRWRILEKIAVL